MTSGWIDFGALGTTPERLRLDRGTAGERVVSAAGMRIATGDSGASLAVRESSVVLAWGDVRFDGDADRTPVEPAERWAAAIARRGAAALADARGRYAVVCLDLVQRRATLATDRFATQPLCYAFKGSRLSFSDRADGVPLGVPPELDAQAIFDYVHFHVIPAPRTIYRGVRRLDLAEELTADLTGSRVRRHWEPRFAEQPKAPLAALKAEFKVVLKEAVERQAATGRIGAFLSGGTDSSTVAGLVGEVTGKPARTFSIGFDVEGYDEMAYARIAARHFGTEHHECYLRPEHLVEAIPLVAAQFDQPFGNSSALPSYWCARMAREAGVDTMLAGDGGDELFGGNTRYARQKLFGLYDRVPGVVRSGFVEPVLLRTPGLDSLPVLKKAASYVEQARMPMPERMNAYNLLARLGASSVLTDEFLRTVDTGDPGAQQRALYERCPDVSLVNRMLAYDWKYTLADNDLPKVRETARLAGTEARFPFLDDAVVEFSLALPSGLKVKGQQLRYFFKEALRGFLPDEVIAKKKHGFGLPFGIWLARHRDLLAFVRPLLLRLPERGIVRRDFIADLIDRRVREHPSYYGEMVWILMMLEAWFERQGQAQQNLERIAVA